MKTMQFAKHTFLASTWAADPKQTMLNHGLISSIRVKCCIGISKIRIRNVVTQQAMKPWFAFRIGQAPSRSELNPFLSPLSTCTIKSMSHWCLPRSAFWMQGLAWSATVFLGTYPGLALLPYACAWPGFQETDSFHLCNLFKTLPTSHQAYLDF